MKITGIVKSAEEITGTKGLTSFHGTGYSYLEDMNKLAGQRIELEKNCGKYDFNYDYYGATYNWLAGWLKDIKEETDWSKVSVDAKVRIKDGSNNKRHFAKYENGAVYTWDSGRTSWSAKSENDLAFWSPDQVELVEDL